MKLKCVFCFLPAPSQLSSPKSHHPTPSQSVSSADILANLLPAKPSSDAAEQSSVSRAWSDFYGRLHKFDLPRGMVLVLGDVQGGSESPQMVRQVTTHVLKLLLKLMLIACQMRANRVLNACSTRFCLLCLGAGVVQGSARGVRGAVEGSGRGQRPGMRACRIGQFAVLWPVLISTVLSPSCFVFVLNK